MNNDTEKQVQGGASLPDNAFRPLKDGEEYEPLMSPKQQYREVSGWSITWGIVMAIIFSAATAYLGLKVGQVFEAAIPITIIAVGVSGATHRKDPLWRKCYHPEHRCLFGNDCGRSHLHPPCTLHPAI